MYHSLVPLVFFLIGYKLSGLIAASGCMCASSLSVIAIDVLRKKKIPGLVVLTTVMSSVVFVISLLTDDPSFVKMKLTIINAALALAFSASLLVKKNPLKEALGNTIEMSDDSWNVLAKRWIALLFFSAAANEVVRHYSSDSAWILFKVFGIMLMNIVFVVAHVPFVRRESTTGEYNFYLKKR